MRNIWVIATKEFKHYFISPIAYAVAFAVLLILGLLFYANILAAVAQQFAPSVQIVLGPMVTLLLFLMPAITMRSLADEQRSGTLELLLTAPVRDWEVVVGKWLGGMLFMLVLLLLVFLTYPLVLNAMVSPGIDQGLMVTGFLGMLLLSSVIIAIGVMSSSFFSNPIAAFFVTIGLLLILWMIGFPAQAMGSQGEGSLLSYLDLSEHFYPTFFVGILDLKDIVYFISVTALALFIGSLMVEMRRWR